jgi:hypothetical protein
MTKELRGFWLDDEVADEYVELLEQLDATKDPKLLLPYLKVPDAVRPFFEDLVDRHKLRSVSRKMPSYKRSDEMIQLWLAGYYVINRPRDTPRAVAIAEAVQRFNVTTHNLELALDGQHASLNRAKFPSWRRRPD